MRGQNAIRQGCYDRRYLPHHTEPSRSGLLVPRLASQLKRRVRHLVSDCSKLLCLPGPPQNGPSIKKPLLRAGLKQGPSATRESGSGPWLSSLPRHNGVGRALCPSSSHPLAPCRATSGWPSAVYWPDFSQSRRSVWCLSAPFFSCHTERKKIPFSPTTSPPRVALLGLAQGH
jgi:hypothetical protein